MPTAADAAIFGAPSTNNATVDAGFAGAVATLKINSGYTGTITLARSLTVSNTYTQADGTFTAAGQALTLKALTLSGGSFTASSGTTSVSGNLAISGSPTFNANKGIVDFTGSSNATLGCDNVTFNLVTFTSTGGTKTVGSDCSLPLGANPSATGGGSITLNGTLSGTGTLTTGKTLTLGATGSLAGFTGLVTDALTVNGTYNFGAYVPFTVGGAFTLSSGAGFTAPSGTASFAKNFTLSSGATFNANGGTVNFNGTTSVTLACGNKTFHSVKFSASTGHKTIGSDCTLPLGKSPSLGSGGTTLKGTLSGTGTLSQAGTFEINGSSPGLSSFGKVADAGSFLLGSEAVFTAPAGELIVSGNFTVSPGAVFNANSGTVNFQALSGTAKTITCNEATFNKAVFTNTIKEVVSDECTLPLGSKPTIGASGGEIVLNGTLSGTGTLTAVNTLTLGATGGFSGFATIALKGTLSGTGTLTLAQSLTLNAGGSLSGFSGLEVKDLTVNGAYNFGSYVPFTAYSFTLNSGATFTAPSETASFSRNFTVDPGATFNANGGTVNFDSFSSVSLACGNKTFNLVSFEESAGHKTIGSDCTLPLGSNPSLGQGGVMLRGTLSGSGDLYQLGTFEIESSAPGLNSFANVTDAGSLLLDAGTVFTAPAGELLVNGNFTVEPGVTFNANGGTVNFQGAGMATKTLSCGEATFNAVELTNTTKQVVGEDCTLPLGAGPTIGNGGPIVLLGKLEGSGTLIASVPTLILREGGEFLGFSGLEAEGELTVKEGAYDFSLYAPFDVAGTFLIEPGASFTAPEGTASFGGDFTNEGEFEANGGTVALAGNGQHVNGSTSFASLTKIAESPDTLTFSAEDTQTVEGALVLEGAGSEELLNLISSEPGVPWLIEAEGSREVKLVSVEDSTNEGVTISASESFDAGGNTGWSFP